MADSTDRLDWFPFRPKDWLDYRVLRMSLVAQGAYIRLLCHCWTDSTDQCSIPDDLDALSRILGVSKIKTKKILAELLPESDPIFSHHEGRYFSKRLAEEKNKGDKLREKRSLAGKKGASSRWQVDGGATAEPSIPNSSATTLPMAKHSQGQVQGQRQRQKGREDHSSPPDPFLDFLFGLALAAKIPNRPQTLRKYLVAWVARFGAEEVQRILESKDARGADVVFIQDNLLVSKNTDEAAARLLAHALDGDEQK